MGWQRSMGSDKISVQNARKPRAKQGHVLSTFVGSVHPGAVQNLTRGTRIRRGFLCINAHAEQEGIELCRIGHSASIEAVHDCHYCIWVDLNKRVSHSVRVRVLRFIRDSAYFARDSDNLVSLVSPAKITGYSYKLMARNQKFLKDGRRRSYQFNFNKCSSANSVTGFSLERADAKFGFSRGRSGAKSGLSTVRPISRSARMVGGLH